MSITKSPFSIKITEELITEKNKGIITAGLALLQRIEKLTKSIKSILANRLFEISKCNYKKFSFIILLKRPFQEIAR